MYERDSLLGRDPSPEEERIMEQIEELKIQIQELTKILGNAKRTIDRVPTD